MTIPSVGTFPVGDGEFTFTLGNAAIGSLHPVFAGTDWTLFTADFTLAAPGDYQLGLRNTLSSPYFINYDAFAIQPVPEPSTIALGLLGALGIAIAGRGRLFGDATKARRTCFFYGFDAAFVMRHGKSAS